MAPNIDPALAATIVGVLLLAAVLGWLVLPRLRRRQGRTAWELPDDGEE